MSDWQGNDAAFIQSLLYPGGIVNDESTIRYIRLNSLVLGGMIFVDGMDIDGGNQKIDSNSHAGMSYANVLDAGREPLTITFDALSLSRDNIERFRQEFNMCPPGAELCYLTEDRVAYVEKASASPTKPTAITKDGVRTWLYKSQAKVVCRDGLLFGPETGGLIENASLPYSLAIENLGGWPAGLDYLMMSGGYVAGKYSTDLQLELAGETIPLCQKLMRGDRWKLGRWGDVLHSYETRFEKTANQTSIDLHGGLDLGDGGETAYQACHLGANGHIMVPFYGPIPTTRAPYLEIEVTNIAGSCVAAYALSADLSDLTMTSLQPRKGLNRLRLPVECMGADFVAVGVATGATGNIEISRLYAEVQRHISENRLPTIDPGETDSIVVSDAEQSNHALKQLDVRYRDLF